MSANWAEIIKAETEALTKDLMADVAVRNTVTAAVLAERDRALEEAALIADQFEETEALGDSEANLIRKLAERIRALKAHS